MRLIADENFPRPSVLKLRASRHDVLAVQETFQGSSDVEVLALAVSEGRILLTFDSDFGELIYGLGKPAPPAVILLRMEPHDATEPASILLPLLLELELLNRFTVVKRNSIRQKNLPHKFNE